MGNFLGYKQYDKRRPVSRNLGLSVYNRCEQECFYCQKSMIQFEPHKNVYEFQHCVPVSSTRKSNSDQYVIACEECLKAKNNKSVEQFLKERNIPTRRCMQLVIDTTYSSQERYCRVRYPNLHEKYCSSHKKLKENRECINCFCKYFCCCFCCGYYRNMTSFLPDANEPAFVDVFTI